MYAQGSFGEIVRLPALGSGLPALGGGLPAAGGADGGLTHSGASL